jgi:ribosome-binding protein aMBF1 (putative translation factor)
METTRHGKLLSPELPWDLITDQRIAQYGYSGMVVKGLRVKSGMSIYQLSDLLQKRKSTVEKIENTPKIGIKLSKKLADIFKVSDWRLLRNNPFEEKEKLNEGLNSEID